LDYTSICKDVIQTPEFKNFLEKTGGEIISSSRQLINGNIVVGIKEKYTAYTFSYLGQARESVYTNIYRGITTNRWSVDGSANVIRKPESQSSKTSEQLYLEAIAAVLARFDKREKLKQDKIGKLSKNYKAQKIAIVWMFDLDKIEYLEPASGGWKTISSFYGPSSWSWDRLVETLVNINFTRFYRIKP